MISSLVSFTLAIASLNSVLAQGDLSAANNVTSLEGTWTSNAAVLTGGDFCIPAEMKFTYPQNTGIAYSFTNTGFFEEAQYRYNSNGTAPNCIQGVIFWQHGTYTLNDDGSMTLNPFSSDGRIQVQDPCAATTNIITYYNQITQYADWGIIIDQSTGNYQLRLNRFDGAKMPYMNLALNPPSMLPTQILTGVNASGQTLQQSTRKRSFTSSLDMFKRSAAPSRTSVGRETILAGLAGMGLVGVVSLGLGLL